MLLFVTGLVIIVLCVTKYIMSKKHKEETLQDYSLQY
jgi:hypothetical protein